MAEDSVNEVATMLFMFNENMAPIYESAAGTRQQLLDQGWSAETADAAGREIIIGLTRVLFATIMGGLPSPPNGEN